jgi:hypothetical protein
MRSLLLTVYVAITTFRARAQSAAVIVAIAGVASIGWMVFVNFIIDSDLKWLILSFLGPWVLALLFYCIEAASKQGRNILLCISSQERDAERCD